MSKKPLSSRKTKGAPSCAAFFYMRPPIAAPMGNRGLVALTGTVLGLLTTPAHSTQEMPKRVGMVAHLKFFPDDFGNTLQSPQLGSVPGRLGATQ
jgi:hypothetical protein